MNFDHNTLRLPISEIISEIQSHLSDNNTLIIHAPPGAGKSTIIPLTLIHEPWLKSKKILMLEPRRLAARTIAMRMASLLGEDVGETVGYRIRFENRVSNKTRIEVVTEGILTRMLHSDNELHDVGIVLFDEFHERSIHADVALALCRESQQVLRNDLRIAIMSATLNVEELQTLLHTKCISSKGRQYPVEIKYCGESDMLLIPELTAKIVVQAAKEQDGDILVFLPGEAEIKKCAELLKHSLRGVRIHPLYGMLPPNKQYAAIMPDKHGTRKVVLASSIAETSLTIEGVSTVVDSGYGRTLKFNANSGLSKLDTIEIAQDSADQRAGRAGRLGPGVCYRMWTKASQERKPAHRIPEIMESDLASLVLDLAHWGVDSIENMCWLTPPPRGHVMQAQEILKLLDAYDNGTLTHHGKEIHALPCHPRISHMLIKARNEGTIALATDVAALLEERDPLPREAGIDISLRIEALRKQRQEKRLQRQMQRVEKVAESYRKLFAIDADNASFDPYEVGLLLVHAYPERIACASPGNNAMFQLANGRYATAGHKDDLAHESWLAIAHMHTNDKNGRIFLAAPINPKDLAPLVKQEEVIAWDFRKDRLQTSIDLRIGSIVLKSTPLTSPNENEVLEALSKAIEKDGERLLHFSYEVAQWQNRVLSLRAWNKNEVWPDVSTAELIRTNKQWLLPYVGKVRNIDHFRALNLKEILHYSLPVENQSTLEALAPSKIEVPSGSKIQLEYQSDSSAPILAVRLQEVFGMLNTPVINNGKNTVLLHLLSPGFKVVQITADLPSFWEHAYFDVKKDLKARYPKHVWPDDPKNEKATNKTKNRKT